jgi:hypothetical protein
VPLGLRVVPRELEARAALEELPKLEAMEAAGWWLGAEVVRWSPEVEQASKDYLEVERTIAQRPATDAVLVSPHEAVGHNNSNNNEL